jgi:hypothetical protein
MSVCVQPKCNRRKKNRAACCEWQANIRANGWLELSASYRSLFEYIARSNPEPCTP